MGGILYCILFQRLRYDGHWSAPLTFRLARHPQRRFAARTPGPDGVVGGADESVRWIIVGVGAALRRCGAACELDDSLPWATRNIVLWESIHVLRLNFIQGKVLRLSMRDLSCFTGTQTPATLSLFNTKPTDSITTEQKLQSVKALLVQSSTALQQNQATIK